MATARPMPLLRPPPVAARNDGEIAIVTRAKQGSAAPAGQPTMASAAAGAAQDQRVARSGQRRLRRLRRRLGSGAVTAALAAAGVTAALCGRAAGQAGCLNVVNSGLESGGSAQFAGWHASGPVTSVANGASSWGGANSGFGATFASLQGAGSSLSQAVPGFVLGTTYRLSFSAAAQPSGSGSSPTTLQVSVGGETLRTIELTGGLFLNYSVGVTANAVTGCTACNVSFQVVSAGAVGLDGVAVCSTCAFISNAQFDAQPNITTWQYIQPTGWTTGGLGLVAVGANGNTPWGQISSGSAGGGTHYAIIQRGGTFLRQTLTGLSPGSRYVLSFVSANRPGYGDGAENIRVSVGGVPLPGGVFQPADNFTRYSLAFTAWSASAVLEFANASPAVCGGRCTVFVDAVSVCESDVVLVNGGFDDSPPGGSFAFASPSGWQGAGSVAVAASGATQWGGLNASTGGHFAVLNAPQSAVRQGLYGLSPGMRYVASFQAAALPSAGVVAELAASLGGVASTLSSAADLRADTLNRFGVAFVPEAPAYELSFNNTSPGAAAVVLDSVVVWDTCVAVHNAGFDVDATPPVGYRYMVPTSWTTTGRVVVAQNRNTPWGGLHSGHGTHYAVLQNNGSSVSQDLVGLIPGRRYTVSLRAALRPNYAAASLNVTLVSNGTTLVNGRAVPHTNNFSRFSFAFDAVDSDRQTTLTLVNTAAASGDRSVFADGVAVCDTCLLVHNNDFEENPHDSGVAALMPNGWVGIGGVLLVENGSPFGGNATVTGGLFYAALQPGASVTQTVYGVAPRRTYRVSWLAALQAPNATGSQQLSVAFGGASHTATVAPGAAFARFSFTVTASLNVPASAALSVSAPAGGGGVAVLVDAVAVCDVCAVVNNGGFEEDLVVGTTLGTGQPSAWATTGNVDVVRQGSVLWQGVVSEEGQHFAILTGAGSSLEQDVYGLEAGAAYTVSFAAAGSRNGQASGLSVAVDGAAVSGAAPLQPPATNFTQYAFSFTASGPSASLRLTSSGPGAQAAVLVDSVAVCPVGDAVASLPPTPAPTPAPTAVPTAVPTHSCNGVPDSPICRHVTDCATSGSLCPGRCSLFCTAPPTPMPTPNATLAPTLPPTPAQDSGGETSTPSSGSTTASVTTGLPTTKPAATTGGSGGGRISNLWIIVAICAGVLLLSCVMWVTRRRGSRDPRGRHTAVKRQSVLTVETVVDNPSFSPTSHHGRAESFDSAYDGFGDVDGNNGNGDDDGDDPDLLGLPVAGDDHGRDSYLHLDDNAEQFQGYGFN